MHRNVEVPVKRSKQHNAKVLLSEQDPFETRRLTAAFVEMVNALPCRPSPRHWWDNVASPGRLAFKGRDAMLAGRIAMDAAIATGDRTTMEATAQRVAVFFDTLKSSALRTYTAISSGELTLDGARIRASKETSEAMHAILTSTVHEDDASTLTVREIDEAIHALSDLRCRMLSAQPQPINRRPALALS